MFTPDYHNALILVADDDPPSLNMLRRLLESDSYRVVTAGDGVEALEKFNEIHPDLVLLDAKMPRMGGYEVCLKLREMPQAKHVPLVIFTAYDDQESIDRAFQVGAADYITKPIHFQVLTHRIRRLLITSFARRALEQERNLLRIVIDNLPEAVFVKDTQSRFLLVNRTQNEWLNIQTDAIQESTDFDFLPEDLAKHYYADEREILATGQPKIDREEPFIDQYSGEPRWHSTTKVPVRDLLGKIIGIVGISRDVTESKRAKDDLERRVEERTQEVALANKALQAEITRREAVEANLLRERNLLRALVDNLPDNIYVKDRESRFLFANRAVTHYMGAEEPDDLIGKLDSEFYPADIAKAFYDDEQSLFETGIPLIDKEEPTHSHSGILHWIQTSKIPVRDAEGNIYALVGIGRDITSRRKAEQNLRLSEAAEREQRVLAESLRDTAAAVNSSLDPEVVMQRILDNVGRVVAHDAANIMLVEGTTARCIASLNYPPDVEHYLRTYRFTLSEIPNLMRLVATGKPSLIADADTDPMWVTLDVFETSWIKSNISVPILVMGEVIGVLNLDSGSRNFFNVQHVERMTAFADQAAVALKNARLYETMRQHAAELEARVAERTQELQRAKDYAETILNSSSDAIIVTRADSTIQTANPAFQRLFGYTNEQVAGLSVIVLAEPAQAAPLADVLEAVAGGALSQRIEIPVRRADGTQFHADIALSAIPGPESEVHQLVCSIRDITQRRMMELGLRETLAKETELGELKSRFITQASHEFRTPLAVILSSLDLLERHGANLPPEQRSRTFSKSRTTVAQMAQLLEDVLNVARAQEGHLEYNPAPIELVTFCQEIMEEIAITSGKQHMFAFSATGDCDDVEMDHTLLRHIISNLLSNAVKYSAPGSTVTFSVACNSRHAIFRVKDEGVGIPEKDMQRLFEPFHRADNVAGVPGTGLGLTIAQKSAEQHGGTISVESQLNKGTTFTVTIPTHDHLSM